MLEPEAIHSLPTTDASFSLLGVSRAKANRFAESVRAGTVC